MPIGRNRENAGENATFGSSFGRARLLPSWHRNGSAGASPSRAKNWLGKVDAIMFTGVTSPSRALYLPLALRILAQSLRGHCIRLDFGFLEDATLRIRQLGFFRLAGFLFKFPITLKTCFNGCPKSLLRLLLMARILQQRSQTIVQ